MLDHLSAVPLAVWDTLAAMAPYLLFGFLMAGLLSVLVSPETVERHLGGRGSFLGPLKAALFGVPLPLCSCGVIPVAASLRRHGAGKGATASFLISTPQTGVDSVLVTYSMLGPVFAVLRPLAAFVSGLLGGVLVGLSEPHDAGTGEADSKPTCEAACCNPRAAGGGEGRLVRALRYGFVTLPRDLWKALVIGLVVAGTIAALVPEDFFAKYFSGGGTAKQLLAMLVMMLIGLPLYVCATASVPLAVAFIHMGISPGAALVFLTTGPATNAAALAVIWKTMGRRATAIYLATVAVTAFAAGLVLNYAIGIADVTAAEAIHEHAGHGILPLWAGPAAAVALLGVLAVAAMPRRSGGEHLLDGRLAMITLSISGMTCSHCANSVTRTLKEARGAAEVRVELKAGRAFVTGEGLDRDELARKIEELGYKVTGVEERPRNGKEGEDGREGKEGKDGHQGHAH